MSDPDELRKVAAWYREFAERAGNPTIWEARLQTAEVTDCLGRTSRKKANLKQLE
jgi:hypothetical protein